MTTEFLNEAFSLDDCAVLNAADPSDITWENAINWTENFRKTFGDKQEFNGKKVKGYFMSRGNIEDLIAQDGLALQGIKIYIGLDENGVFRTIIVAVKGNESIDYKVPETRADLNSTSFGNLPVIGEVRPCPEWCGKKNVLNES